LDSSPQQSGLPAASLRTPQHRAGLRPPTALQSHWQQHLPAGSPDPGATASSFGKRSRGAFRSRPHNAGIDATRPLKNRASRTRPQGDRQQLFADRHQYARSTTSPAAGAAGAAYIAAPPLLSGLLSSATAQDASNHRKPLNGVTVDTWHANAHGLYSDETSQQAGGATSGGDTSGQNFLRGYQITGKDAGIHRSAVAGQVSFQTIWPGRAGRADTAFPCCAALGPARCPGIVAGDRRRPAASSNTSELEDMTRSSYGLASRPIRDAPASILSR
jgi:hypothetical protein